MQGREGAVGVPPAIERFVKQLVVTWKAVLLYPPASAIPRRNAEIAAVTLQKVLRETSDVVVSVSKNTLGFAGVSLFAGQPAYESFALELYQRNVADVRFHAGADGTALLVFLNALKDEPAQLEAVGGIESRLWEAGVDTITVTEARVAIVDGEVPSTVRADLTVAEIDDLVAEGLQGGERDLRVLTRILSETETFRSWLETSPSGSFDLMRAGDRVTDLAQAAQSQSAPDRQAAWAGIAAGVLALPPDELAGLLAERLLPAARHDKAIAGVVRAMEPSEVCAALVGEEPTSDDEVRALAESIRSLAVVSGVAREDVYAEAGSAMLAAGFSQETADRVLEAAAPSRVLVEGAPAPEAEGAESMLAEIARSLEMDTMETPDIDHDESFGELAAEAGRGVTDGDIVAALVDIVTIEPDDARCAESMPVVADSLNLLLERGELELAAEAAESLTAAAEREDVSEESRQRILAAVSQLAHSKELGRLLEIVRTTPEGSIEHASAARLLDALGEGAIEPMLELLADEPDMAARKAIVDLLSGMAADHIPELGRHLADPRWYFVRNVVAVLGAARRSATLQYLQRTLRHPDARVRRETIRAARVLPDRLATDMLVAALEDDDAQNVQLAARYLGIRGAPEATSALEVVARGEGRGSREIGPRTEAMEALGTLTATDALPTLDAIAERRTLLGGGRQRELRTAAKAAADRIRAKGGAR